MWLVDAWVFKASVTVTHSHASPTFLRTHNTTQTNNTNQHKNRISFSFLGMLTTVFAFSALCFLLVEKPLANLERALLSGGGGGKKGK